MDTDTAAAHRATEAVWRLESARIIAGLAGLVRDVGLAEELAAQPGRAAGSAARAESRPLGPAADQARFHRPAPGRPARRPARPLRPAGGDRGLEIVDGLAATPTLAGYHHLPSVRGDLLARLGRYGEAAGEFRRAASLTRNTPERTVLLQRAAECDTRT